MGASTYPPAVEPVPRRCFTKATAITTQRHIPHIFATLNCNRPAHNRALRHVWAGSVSLAQSTDVIYDVHGHHQTHIEPETGGVKE